MAVKSVGIGARVLAVVCYTALVPHVQIRGAYWLLISALSFGFLLLFTFLLTSSDPWVPVQRAATAQQVDAARDLFREVRRSRSTGRATDLLLRPTDLDSVAAMVSQAFAPNRLELRLEHGTLTVTASRPLLVRWINVRVKASSRSVGFPVLDATVGSVHLPTWLSRAALALGRELLAMRGAHLPPLDRIVQSTIISTDSIRARILLPRTGLIEQAVSSSDLELNDATVSRIYCRLTAQQRFAPDPLFAHQLQRALGAAEATPDQHGAALIALAMLVVDPRVGELVGDTPAKVASCIIPPPATTLQMRTDWPKHWSLSAALTVAAGSRVAVAMGEWKELSDSLSKNAYLAHGDPSGFSFVDLAADRAGFLTARQLTDPARLGETRARLLKADDEHLLPQVVTRLNDGMGEAEFVRRFGALDDPRFAAALSGIDAGLHRAGSD